jgi:outer membrane protein
MQRLYSLLVLVIALFLGAGKTVAQHKIGYIDLRQLITMMPEYKKAGEMLDEYEKALLQNAKEIRDAYLQADSIFANGTHYTGTHNQESLRRLREAYLKAAEFGPEQVQKMRMEKEQEIMEPISRKAVQTIQAVAKEKGITYVLNTAQLISFPPGDDLLPFVAKKLKLTLTKPTDTSALPKLHYLKQAISKRATYFFSGNAKAI